MKFYQVMELLTEAAEQPMFDSSDLDTILEAYASLVELAAHHFAYTAFEMRSIYEDNDTPYKSSTTVFQSFYDLVDCHERFTLDDDVYHEITSLKLAVCGRDPVEVSPNGLVSLVNLLDGIASVKAKIYDLDVEENDTVTNKLCEE